MWKPDGEFVKYTRPRAELSQRLDIFSRALADKRPNAVAFPIQASAKHREITMLPPLSASLKQDSLSASAPASTGVPLHLLDTWSGKRDLRSTSSLTAGCTQLRTPTGSRRDVFVTERRGMDDYSFSRAKGEMLHPTVGTICDTDTADEVIMKLNDAYPKDFQTVGSYGTVRRVPQPLKPRRVATVLVCKGKVLEEAESIGMQCRRLNFRPLGCFPNVERNARFDIATRARMDERPASVAHLPGSQPRGQHCEM